MTETLFDSISVNHDEALVVRRRALGGAVQTLRARQGWKVADAAVAAHIAPMTYRRIEDGMTVREKSYLAVDVLFDVAPGTVKRALRDDTLMVEIVGRAGVDVRHVTPDRAARFLDSFARQTTTGETPQPAVTPDMAEALRLASQHVPAATPTNLALAHRLVEQLLDTTRPTPATKALLKAALEAMPDLIAEQLHDCEDDVRAAARRSAHQAADLVPA